MDERKVSKVVDRASTRGVDIEYAFCLQWRRVHSWTVVSVTSRYTSSAKQVVLQAGDAAQFAGEHERRGSDQRKVRCTGAQ